MSASDESRVKAVPNEPSRPVPCQPRLSVLLLCDDRRDHANTVLDHIGAFRRYSQHDVFPFNPSGLKRNVWLDLDEFDVVVIHYSLVIISDHYLPPQFRDRLRRFRGLKVQFIQDEHRWVNQITAMMRYIGIDALFSLVPEQERHKIYNQSTVPGVVTIGSLAGYISDELVGRTTLTTESRPIDIGYRGRALPYWMGLQTQEKVWIGQGVLERAEKYQLRCDIAWQEETRLYGRQWIRFLSSCKATLGTESGASITDFDGSVEKRTKDFLAENPEAEFHEVSKAVLEPFENNVHFNVVSPRIFEAAALRTALILFPGHYSGVMQPWVHYIPLAKDFSNMDEVVEKLRDKNFLRSITKTAYEDLVASGRYSYRSFIREFDAVLSQYGSPSGSRHKARYRLSRIERSLIIGAMKARAMAEPFRLILEPLLKGCIALKLLTSTCGGRKILLKFLAEGEGLRRDRLRELLTDILKLAILRQARINALRKNGGFSVSVRFDPGEGQLLFVSHVVHQENYDAFQKPGSKGKGSRQEACWPELESAIQEGRLRTMIWNHSALGGEVRYALTPSRGLSIRVGEYDFHRFQMIEQLAQRYPEQMWDLLSSVFGVGAASSRGDRTHG